MKWSRLKSKYILRSKWLNVRKDTIKISNNVQIDDYYVVEKNNVVLILPIIENKYILLKREYRYPINKFTIELPGGTYNLKTEKPSSAAQRELLEETGLKSKDWTNLGVFYDYPTRDSNKITLFLANECYQVNIPKHNIQENITTIKISLNHILDYIENNSIEVNGSISCIFKALLHLKKLKMSK